MPIQNANAISGISVTYSRQFKSGRCSFEGFVLPEHHALIEPEQISRSENDAEHAPGRPLLHTSNAARKIANSPTKPFKSGRPSELSVTIM